MKREKGALTDVVAQLQDTVSERGSDIAVGDLVDALEHRGYGPALAVLPLLELTPIGGIPGFPTLLAAMLALITVRLVAGYERFWVPDWIRRRKLSADKTMKSLKTLEPLTLRIDGQLHERLSRFAGPTGRRAACVVILGLLLTVPPLEVIPFATSGPMIVISIFGLGLLFRDGLLMLIGFTGAFIAVGAAVSALSGSA